jgi:cysteine-rich repeat protein
MFTAQLSLVCDPFGMHDVTNDNEQFLLNIQHWLDGLLQPPLDRDGAGALDSVDNCILVPNGPLIPDAGGNIQLDSDADGFGNLCDGDFNQELHFIGKPDLLQFREAIGKDRGSFDCPQDDGPPGGSCAEFDLDGNRPLIGIPDLRRFRQLLAGYSGPSGLVPSCGDGILQEELEEECDDGNIDSGDGCSRICDIPGDDCQDGHDNDADGLVDLDDPGCASASAAIENPRCDDWVDNDRDGRIDRGGFDDGFRVYPADPNCASFSDNRERGRRRGCGLGFELVLVVPLLMRRLSSRGSTS